jgi:ATP-binding cassette, subfamily G (WHITE), member 2, SNQ2
VIQNKEEGSTDWVDVWNKSKERQQTIEQLEALNNENATKTQEDEDQSDYATSHWFQFRMVTQRLLVQLWRSPVSLIRYFP